MVTGSVGKTSTKDAIGSVLSMDFYTRKSDKSYNSGFGVPLTIIGAKNPWANPLKWFGVFGEALATILFPNHYPKLLVLEVGADRPGDLAQILKIAKPDVTVVTLLPSVPVHVEAYETPAAVREEEFAPAAALPAGAPLIYNADDPYATEYAEAGFATPYTFGTSEQAMVQITDVGIWLKNGRCCGMQGRLLIEGEKHSFHVAGALGRSQLFAPAAAVATGLALGMTIQHTLEGLESYVPPPGRGRIFEGKMSTLLIDDTYNSSPAATEEVLRSLSLIPTPGRTVAVLGDMLELGRYSVAEHARVGHIAAEMVEVLVTVGQRSQATAVAAREDGMTADSVYEFTTSLEAAAGIEDILKEGDTVLIKGSQSMRMERIVRPLLAKFADVQQLVRQDAEWLKR